MQKRLPAIEIVGFDQLLGLFVRVENRFMARSLAKSTFVLLALGLWILAGSASWAEEDDPNALNRQVDQLIDRGKFQEGIPIAERASSQRQCWPKQATIPPIQPQRRLRCTFSEIDDQP
jgi:hypothetical protein